MAQSLHHINDNWETPPEVFARYGAPHRLSLDVCAEASSSKCPEYFSPALDGLTQNWSGRVWMNPPCSNLRAWVAKAFRSRNHCECIVCLLPARTDTKWFHSYVYRRAAIRFIKGRISFVYQGDTFNRSSFPLMIVTYRPDNCVSHLQTKLELGI